MSDRNLLILEYLRTKFVPRGYPASPEWSITVNAEGLVRVSSRLSANRTLTSFVPIRVVQKKRQNGQCVLLESELREFTGRASPNHCEYDDYVPDPDGLASLQSQDSLASGEKQKAFLGMFDLSGLQKTEQDTVLNGQISLFDGRAISSMAVSFEKYTMNSQSGEGELTVSFENGDLGQLTVLPMRELTFLESFTGRLLSVSLEPSDLQDENGNCRPPIYQLVGCTGRGSAECSNPDSTKAFSEKPFCGNALLGSFLVDASAATTNYFLSSSGELLTESGSRVGSEPKLDSINFFRGKWYSLSSDGTVFTGTDVSRFSSFEAIRCLKLERAQVLAMGRTPQLSCQ